MERELLKKALIGLYCLSIFLLCHKLESKQQFKYELSAVAMFQNEAPYLKEWIEYHRMVGVQHFYLYNNSSTDNFLEVLNPYIRKNIVELKEWPSPDDQNWIEFQCAAINDAIAISKDKTNWLALIDIDEFIVPHHTNSLHKFLQPYDKIEGVAGVVINWQMFGTSHIWEIPPGMLMIESLIRKAKKTCHHNQNQKSIVKPRYCCGNWIHYGDFIAGYGNVLPLNSGQFPYTDEIQVNHYWLRDEKFLREVKAPRRARLEGGAWNEAIIQSYIEEMNEEVDISIQRFIPQLKKRVFGKKIINS